MVNKVPQTMLDVLSEGDVVVYHKKGSYELRSNNAHVYEGLKDKYGLNVELMPGGTDFLNLPYGG